jgi:hypothetical protein
VRRAPRAVRRVPRPPALTGALVAASSARRLPKIRPRSKKGISITTQIENEKRDNDIVLVRFDDFIKVSGVAAAALGAIGLQRPPPR